MPWRGTFLKTRQTVLPPRLPRVAQVLATVSMPIMVCAARGTDPMPYNVADQPCRAREGLGFL